MNKKLAGAYMLILLLTAYSIITAFIPDGNGKEYVVYRSNYNDTMSVEADTFRVYPRDHKVFFVVDGKTTSMADSVNKITIKNK